MAINAILGDPEQNSYVTEEEATAYFDDRAYSSLWEGFVDKEPLLILCSRAIDWYITWKGLKKSIDQPMQWPRVNVFTREGIELPHDELPHDVKVAVYEMALASLTEDRTTDDPLLGLEQLRVASLMLKAKPDRSAQITPSKTVIPDRVFKILKDLRSPSAFGVVRLMRG